MAENISSQANVGAVSRAATEPQLEAGSPRRYDIYPTKEEYQDLKKALLEEDLARALRWDNRAASRGPYIDLSREEAQGLDLARFDPYRTAEAKAAFEVEMERSHGGKARQRQEVKAAAEGRPVASLAPGDGKRIELYPARAQNDELKRVLQEIGARDGLVWDRANRRWYLDLSRPGAGKADLAALAPYRTAEAKAAFEAEQAGQAKASLVAREEVRSAGVEAKQAHLVSHRPVPEQDREWAERPLWMPSERSAKFEGAKIDVIKRSTQALLAKFGVTEGFINQMRGRQTTLQAAGEDLDPDSRSRLVAALNGKAFLRRELVDRGLTMFRPKQKETGVVRQMELPAAEKAAGAAVVSAKPVMEAGAPAAAPAAAEVAVVDPAPAMTPARRVLSEAARLGAMIANEKDR